VRPRRRRRQGGARLRLRPRRRRRGRHRAPPVLFRHARHRLRSVRAIAAWTRALGGRRASLRHLGGGHWDQGVRQCRITQRLRNYLPRSSADGGLDWDALAHAVRPETGCALIQRSCGYSWRKSLGIDDIRRTIDLIKMQNPNCKVMVDNCYGEFVETSEPPMVGADLIAGSLIKNPGGTIAPCGGYVAGKKDLVAAAAARLSAPGLGVEFGSAPGHVMRAMFQGLFLAPQMVGEAVKGGLLIAEVMSAKGYRVQPLPRAPRHDIVQAVELGNRERLIAFCEVVQQTCPVGSFIKPIAGETPGYASEVIFADGTFMDGSTSELSCDGPLRDPYAVFCQGGTHWTQWALVLGEVLKVI
uniref:Aluminum resistance protein n=1 Tax=Aegilops tauschii subsp. strangulata TaxID=200361 RepID=A0A453DAN3_AEGTS